MKVLVLMSTYNGEKYLREQIESILHQEGVELKLLIRDDGSSDATRQILSEYAALDEIAVNYGANAGFVGSFSELLKQGVSDSFNADYFAFSDQDDIWFANKLKVACMALERTDKEKPCLHQSNSMLIDVRGSELHPFQDSDPTKYGRGSALIHGSVQGCGMVFNRKAAEMYVTKMPRQSWHDRWMFLICYYLGETLFCQEPLFYYRIHGNNTLAKSGITKKEYLTKQYKGFLKEPLHLIMAREFYSAFEKYISETDERLFLIYFSYRHSIIQKLNILFTKDFAYPFKHGKGKYMWKVILGRV